jgi:hypothetical protein
VRLNIELRDRDFKRLQELADAERRPVRDQAAYLVEQKLREARTHADRSIEDSREPIGAA